MIGQQNVLLQELSAALARASQAAAAATDPSRFDQQVTPLILLDITPLFCPRPFPCLSCCLWPSFLFFSSQSRERYSDASQVDETLSQHQQLIAKIDRRMAECEVDLADLSHGPLRGSGGSASDLSLLRPGQSILSGSVLGYR